MQNPAGIKIYLAGPLFSLTERSSNRAFAGALEGALPGSRIVLPQDFKVEGDYNDGQHWNSLFRQCLEGIDSSDAVVAVVDGADADSGTAFEMGYAYKADIPVLALRTDLRQNQDRGVNMMLSRGCAGFVLRMSFEEDVDTLAKAVATEILKILGERQA